MIIALIDEAVAVGARLKSAAAVMGLSARNIIRWKQNPDGDDRRKGPLKTPSIKLTDLERRQVLKAANSAQFRDLSPKQVVPALADQGVYIASESSFYRILREHQMMIHRQSSKPPVFNRPHEQASTGPCQVWSWDITYLRSAVRGRFFYLYMIVDIWSRKIMAARVYENESMEYSARLFTRACMIHGVEPGSLVLHSDNGGPMKGSTMLATLQKLGVVPSFSRPRVSDDNPYSEALFRTLKYRPNYPDRPFASVEQAQSWVDDFTVWYNTAHLHSAIRFITPDDRHYGREQDILSKRKTVYEKARMRNPNRWTTGKTRNWDPIDIVLLNPDNKKHVQIDPFPSEMVA
jgi:transposase InsO family protein